jgi:nucleotide-binding universal stress UspA family protein
LADDALEHALETFDCRITVLNVVTTLDAHMSEGGILEVDDDRVETARQRANRLIDRSRRTAAEADRSVETAIETGDPADTILEYVHDHDVDHVVMGGHGGDRGELSRRLLGTVATAVVGDAPVSVTVVR